MDVRLYVKAKSRSTVAEWLAAHGLPVVTRRATLLDYSTYFVMARTDAERLKDDYPQRDLRIMPNY